jgi:hypothetical protein
LFNRALKDGRLSDANSFKRNFKYLVFYFGVTDSAKRSDVLEGVQEFNAVVALEDGLSLVSAGSDVVHSAGVFDSERTGHGASISKRESKSQTFNT